MAGTTWVGLPEQAQQSVLPVLEPQQRQLMCQACVHGPCAQAISATDIYV